MTTTPIARPTDRSPPPAPATSPAPTEGVAYRRGETGTRRGAVGGQRLPGYNAALFAEPAG